MVEDIGKIRGIDTLRKIKMNNKITAIFYAIIAALCYGISTPVSKLY
jgi:hypothetical protein